MKALKPPRVVTQPHDRILSKQPRLQASATIVHPTKSARDRTVHAKIQLIEALCSAVKAIPHAPQHDLCAQARKPLPCAQYLVSSCACKPRAQPLDAFL